MKFEKFKAGRYVQRFQYKSFEPVEVNHNWIWEDATINELLEGASLALGELNAFSLIVDDDIDVFITMHVVKEAQSSSKIEGTKTAIDEVLMKEEDIQPEKRDDWHELRNFIMATHQVVNKLEELPLCNRLLQEAHATLMQGVRGESKQPGEFRRSQNWIGGSELKDAAFIPPHQDSVVPLMGDLEKFWHNKNIKVPHLIRIAISHYQFETIHPFLDGNGRIGRLLIPLYLISNGFLKKPSLYLSDFFERNRSSYFDALTRVRMSNDLIHWVRFFLNGVEKTASKGRDAFNKILKLKNKIDETKFSSVEQDALARRAIKFLYSNPLIFTSDLSKALKINLTEANDLIRLLVEKDILTESNRQGEDKSYFFHRYITLFFS